MDKADQNAVKCRQSTAGDRRYAQVASKLIRSVSGDFDMALRPAEFLAAKIESGQAALALDDNVLVGFGYYSEWENARFVSHSGLVVKPNYRGRGLGSQLKAILLAASQHQFPQAVLMSLTNSASVKAMNLKLGFQVASFEELTTDSEFWAGCKHCRSYLDSRTNGRQCCCEAMVLRPK